MAKITIHARDHYADKTVCGRRANSSTYGYGSSDVFPNQLNHVTCGQCKRIINHGCTAKRRYGKTVVKCYEPYNHVGAHFNSFYMRRWEN